MSQTGISLTFHGLTPQSAATILAAANGQPSAGVPASPAPAAAAPPPPPAAAAAPPPAASAAPPPPAPAAAPPPPPPPPPPAAGDDLDALRKATATSMQTFANTHKAAGVKKVLGMCGIAGLTVANKEQLDWLKATFDSNVLPA